ncbi:phosphoribosylanthranilate isomerase [Spiribacter halobius]|uniref:N-(5'-phosphoribosyl)anthranilate isomerase n=1 Tax=Sediminicurvatus halobius TaxID=2182432 RepID=A0A2U2N8W1_9GAMM|nr:phosphoribosylanthranilate isomerase [Spiribacter halobius]PWG65379.1 N-(5'-phosphoribosyl)anthranilate isomerase [Spiribacter halobius]UEX76397.1 phosphoribosylanthranilate isomerase [Spiribacter halobius]
MRTRVKVCCIQSIAEARLAVAMGADALGLVGAMPSGPGPIPDAAIAGIARSAPPAVATFLLTSRASPDAVAQHVLDCQPTVVQLVDAVPAATYSALRERCPGVRIVQVIHVEDGRAPDQAAAASRHVDGLLLDSGRPAAAVRELGGTGRVHDWTLSRRIVEAVDVPVFLAGGLRPGNVAAAIREVTPFAVDLCSGVRTDGALDREKLKAFMLAVRSADQR